MTNSSLFIARTNNSPIGCIEVRAGRAGLMSVSLLGMKPDFAVTDITPSADDPAGIALQQIKEYLDGNRRSFTLTIDWTYINPFQAAVLEYALRIPFGEVTTYGKIAEALGKPAASRAVGGALANNPIPIIIPCHRVVAANGALTGFSAADGITAKKWLLELEGHTIVGQKLA